MKRSGATIATVVVGLILIVLAPVWRWVVAPQFMKVPDNIDIASIYKGSLTLYVDPQNMTIYPKGKEVSIPLAITRRNTSKPGKSDSTAAVIKERLEARDPAGNTMIEWTRYYALDRKNSQNVAGHNSDTDRQGYYIMLPMGAKKTTYQMWDEDLKNTGGAKFFKVDTRQGEKHKDVKVFVFKVTGTAEPMVKPPIGLPATLPGKTIKVILDDPNIALPDETMFPIEYLKKTEATLVAEPRTGALVDIPMYREEYYANAALPGQNPNLLLLAVLDYKQTAASVSKVVDDSAGYFGLLDLVTVWLPVIFLVVGLILLLIGIFPGRKRAARVVEPEAEKTEPPRSG
ncbi:MAG: DUF3068 domain-containing protein [Actinobacteria bacterium]|nr:DUF3068 domain-containing protein [Actinomycetota bacterium]